MGYALGGWGVVGAIALCYLSLCSTDFHFESQRVISDSLV